MPPLPRSVYLSRLRRAFLLRVHPDRFRSHPGLVRARQASLVQALSNRLEDPDFATWQAMSSLEPLLHSPRNPLQHPSMIRQTSSTFPFLVERRDGSFWASKLELGGTVDDILKSMALAIEQSGAAAIPLPTTLTAAPSGEEGAPFSVNSPNNDFPSGSSFAEPASPFMGQGRYEVNSLRGRDFMAFLSSQSPQDLRAQSGERKRMRTDATAAAAQVRRLFGFSSVNATSLRWSSSSVAVLLKRLVVLHEEHASALNVSSFYPVRLQITTAAASSPSALSVSSPSTSHKNDDDDNDSDDGMLLLSGLDLHGGVLRLHPGATPLQWLESLRMVTPERLTLLRQRQEQLAHYAACVSRDILSRASPSSSTAAAGVVVRFIQGYSCSSLEYHRFIRNLYEGLLSYPSDRKVEDDVASASGESMQVLRALSTQSPSETILPEESTCFSSLETSLVLEPLVATVEASQSIRRAKVTLDGQIRLQADMDPSRVRQALADLGDEARIVRRRSMEEQEQCSHLVAQLQSQIGLGKVYRASSSVQSRQYHMALSRLLGLLAATGTSESSPTASDDSFESIMGSHPSSSPHHLIQKALAGMSLGIAGSGRHCHLADDGSLVIPHDWR